MTVGDDEDSHDSLVAECETNENTVYLTLRSRFPRLLREVAAAKGVVVLPPNASLPNPLTRGFLEHHVLKPSPFFKGQFTVWGRTECGVENRDNLFLITIGAGWRCSSKLRIVKTETMHTSCEGSEYRVMFVNDHFFAMEEQLNRLRAQSKLQCAAPASSPPVRLQPVALPPVRQASDISRVQTLLGVQFSTTVASVCDGFLRSYVLLPGCSTDASQRVQLLFEEAGKASLSALAAAGHGDRKGTGGDAATYYPLDGSSMGQRNVEAVHCVSTDAAMHRLHTKLWPYWVAESKDYDASLLRNLRALHRASPASEYAEFIRRLGDGDDDAGDNPFLCVSPADLQPAVRHLRGIFEECAAPTPLCFMTHMQQVLDRVKAAVPPERHPDLCADNILPALVWVIVQSQTPGLEALCAYTLNLSPEPVLHSELGYALTTVQAAVGIASSVGESAQADAPECGVDDVVYTPEMVLCHAPVAREVAGGRKAVRKPRSGSGGGGAFGAASGSEAAGGVGDSPAKMFGGPEVAERRITITNCISIDKEPKPVGDFLASLLK